MKPAESLSDRKVERAQCLFALDDAALLEQLEDFMDILISHGQVKDPISPDDIAVIQRSIEDCKTNPGTPLDEYLKELEAL